MHASLLNRALTLDASHASVQLSKTQADRPNAFLLYNDDNNLRLSLNI